MILRAIFSMILVVGCYCFNSGPSGVSSPRIHRGDVSMKWMFTKGMGSLQDLGGIGAQGEYYYIPSKKPTLKAPDSVLGIN